MPQQDQLRKQLAESYLDGNLQALFDETSSVPLRVPIATNQKFLVADDSALIRKLVRTLTDRSGGQLRQAEDGAEALRLV
ncbi:MAG: hypothetical protein FJY95_00225 [Candidatus Handelsmanbacteria bacterium]|nr:hypothetical protein [Candidatus Handelsmanbacteria bacterium]